MKTFKILILILFIATIGCSKDDDNNDNIVNGVDRTPNLQATGSSANDFLSGSRYNELKIEVLYVQGYRPTAQALDNLRLFLEARLNKPAGISIVEREIAIPGNAPYDINEIASIESNHRTLYNNSDTLALCILFADGGTTNDTSTSFTLGSAYRNTSCVIYESSIHNFSDNDISEPSRADLETTVLLHEICHLLGLVNLGSPMVNEHLDEPHDKHCDNEDCLMFWETETNSVLGMMLSGNIPTLDANCIADLQANGGK